MLNPAIALYDTWQTALEGVHGPLQLTQTKAMFYGRTPNYGIGQMLIPDPHPGQPATTAQMGLAFGYTSGNNASYFYPQLVIAPNGEFRFQTPPTGGWQQRDRIARNTFLSWRRFAGQNAWSVDLDEMEGSYRRYDWRQPVHYVNDKTLGLGNAYGSYGGSAWLKLEQEGSEWTIQFSRNSVNQGYATSEANFLRMRVLRERRYRSWEREHLIQTGVLKPDAPRTRLTPAQQQERFDKAADALTGALLVTRRPTNLMKKETA
jgi:hypothetical protein